jgi:hypothetical protein
VEITGIAFSARLIAMASHVPINRLQKFMKGAVRQLRECAGLQPRIATAASVRIGCAAAMSWPTDQEGYPQISASNQWQIHSSLDATNEINGAAVHVSDVVFA